MNICVYFCEFSHGKNEEGRKEADVKGGREPGVWQGWGPHWQNHS